jgi:uncharacterized membrane protein YidH (DUF202 family)
MADVYRGPVNCGACGAVLPPDARGWARCSCGREVRVFRFRPFRSQTRPQAVSVQSGAPCAYHSGNAATVICARCGSFLCDLCATKIQEAVYCPPCFERLLASGEMPALTHSYSRPHVVAVILGLISLIPFFGLLAAPFGIAHVVRALKRRRELRERGENVIAFVSIAIVFIVLGLVITLAAFLDEMGR